MFISGKNHRSKAINWFPWKIGQRREKQAGLDITIVMEANDVMNKTFYREIYVKDFLQFT